MNWDQIEGKRKQFTGSARECWGRIADNKWEVIAGRKNQLVGRVQERYGVAMAEAELQAGEWSRALKQSEQEKRVAVRLWQSGIRIKEWEPVKPAKSRVADFWCRLMHTQALWPSHGQYECWKCGRRHRVSWEEPSPASPPAMAFDRETQARGALAPATESRVQCLQQ